MIGVETGKTQSVTYEKKSELTSSNFNSLFMGAYIYIHPAHRGLPLTEESATNLQVVTLRHVRRHADTRK